MSVQQNLHLYYTEGSPPCRSVLTVLTILNVPHEIHVLDLAQKDQFKPEILAMNPQHTIPILKDNETVILDSHVINAYLVDKYAKDDKLYPKCPKARARVDHKLHYDTGILFPAYREVKRGYVPYKTITGVTAEIVKNFEDIYSTVERFLKDFNFKFIAGNDATIADISFYTSLTTMSIIWKPKGEKFPLTVAYIERCGTDIPHLKKINDPGLDIWRKVMEGFKYTL